MGLKRNRVERRYKFMKCKRLCAWLLCLVMMFSLLPVSAAAKWYDKHSVTVKYEFKDDSSKSKPDDVKRTIASTEGAIIAFKVKEPGYNHSAKVTSGNAECSIDAGFLHVKHVDADSVITVTYTPKDNVIIPSTSIITMARSSPSGAQTSQSTASISSRTTSWKRAQSLTTMI